MSSPPTSRGLSPLRKLNAAEKLLAIWLVTFEVLLFWVAFCALIAELLGVLSLIASFIFLILFIVRVLDRGEGCWDDAPDMVYGVEKVKS